MDRQRTFAEGVGLRWGARRNLAGLSKEPQRSNVEDSVTDRV